MTRRSTRTITVLLQASLTTTPWRTRLGISAPRRRLTAPLAENGLDAGDVAPHLAHPRGVFELTAGALKTQVEDLLAESLDLLAELVLGAGAQVAGLHPLHACSSSPWRITNRVAICNLAAASSNASRATSGATPSSSNMIRPGLTRHTQNSGEPLPLPMRTSAGLLDTGTSGKMRIHTRPTRRIWRGVGGRAPPPLRPAARAPAPAPPRLWPRMYPVAPASRPPPPP